MTDYEHYLSQQILPPIERLCEPIEGTDRSRLAECLGLDPNRYRTVVAGDSDERAFGTLDSLMSDSERFKDAKPFEVRCRACEATVACAPLSDRQVRLCSQFPAAPPPSCASASDPQRRLTRAQQNTIVQPSGLTCPACKASLGTASVQAQLEVQIREHITRYYEGWAVCDDPTCDRRTRSMGVYGRRCLRDGCRGNVVFEVRPPSPAPLAFCEGPETDRPPCAASTRTRSCTRSCGTTCRSSTRRKRVSDLRAELYPRPALTTCF